MKIHNLYYFSISYDYTETKEESRWLIRKVIKTEKKRVVCGGVMLDE